MKRMHVPRREMSQVLGFEVEEVETGAVDVSQVIVKCVTGIGCSLLAVTGEVQLCAQRASSLNRFSCRRSRFEMVRAVAINSSTFPIRRKGSG
jgi:hypothetical protein